MNQKFLHWVFEKQGWRWLIFAPLMVIIMPLTLIHFATLDPDISDNDRRSGLSMKLENELKSIELPTRSAINKFERSGKPLSSILVTMRYRTELDREQFLETMNSELEKRSWISYDNQDEGAFTTFAYCRGKFDAHLDFEKSQGIWADGGDYWSLSFSLGLRTRPLFGFDKLPESCRGGK
jgi:hypothetical protein